MNTINFLNNIPLEANSFGQTIKSIRNNLYSIGICWTDDAKGEFQFGKKFRVVLYNKKNNVDFKNPLVKECNGLVVSYNGVWSLCSIPLQSFCTNKVSMKKVNDLYRQGCYDTYEVLDATILTLYYYNDSWKLSSTKGYDVTNTEIIQNVTYMEAFNSIISSKYESFNFSDLNKQYSYTIALRYSDYHIFDETKHIVSKKKHMIDLNSYIMVMCIGNRDNGKYMNKSHFNSLPVQTPSFKNETSVYVLTKYAKSAYLKYAKAYQLDNFKYKPLYGYILRSNNKSVPEEYKNIYIESDLFKIIRHGLYKNNDVIKNRDFNKLITSLYLSSENKISNYYVFNQFKFQFDQLNGVIDSICASVFNNLHGNENEDFEFMDIDKNVMNQIINELMVDVSEMNIEDVAIIKDLVFSIKYIPYIQSLLNVN
jgi:hypothetical protein